MKEFLLFLPLTVFYLAVKSTLLPGLPLPDLPLLIVFYIGYRKASVEGAVFSFVLGYLDDAFNGGVIGTGSFSLVFIFLLAHLLARKVHFTTPAFRASGAAFLTLVKAALVYAVLRPSNVDVWFLARVMLQAVITGLLAPPIITFFSRLTALVAPRSFKDNLS